MKFSLTLSVLAATIGNTAGQTLFEEIEVAGDYSQLLAAVTSTDADTVIAGIGSPVTIFGPNDAAFDAISATLADFNSTQLLGVLAEHVVVGEYPASAVVAAGCVELPTIGGGMIGVSYSEAMGVMVNGATVVEADITGEGGIMHGVGAVLGEFTPCPSGTPTMPPTSVNASVVYKARAAGNYNILTNAVLEGDDCDCILASLQAAAPITVFGPNDAAFTAAAAFVQTLNTTELTGLLAGHVVQGEYTAEDVKAAGCVELTTLAGTMIQVMYHTHDDHDRRSLAGHTEMGFVMINGAHVVEADIMADDGIFHGIDEIILPGTFSPCPVEDPAPAPTAAPEDSAASIASTSVAMLASIVALFSL